MSRALLTAAVCIPLIIAALTLPHACTPAHDSLSPRERAREQVLAVCRRLHRLRRPDGWHQRVTEAGETDEWGNPLRVEYRRWVEAGYDHEACTVRGAGPDGEWGTEDDVQGTLFVVRPAR